MDALKDAPVLALDDGSAPGAARRPTQRPRDTTRPWPAGSTGFPSASPMDCLRQSAGETPALPAYKPRRTGDAIPHLRRGLLALGEIEIAAGESGQGAGRDGRARLLALAEEAAAAGYGLIAGAAGGQ